MENKYLKLAREAREEGNTEDAKKYYDMARTDEPENGEAKYFYFYYSLYEGKNIEIASRFDKLCTILENSVKKVSESEDSRSEKIAIINAIVDSFVPETWSLNRYMNHLTVGNERVLSNSEIVSVSKNGMQACYRLGDVIEKYFGGDEDAMKAAVKSWKEAISLQQKWYAYGDKTAPERYAAKVKEFDPSYEMPKKAGCISFADKKN